MQYQLVLHLPGDTMADYEAMVALEDQLIAVLGSSAEVDGHDSGVGECNIFIHTDHPAATFQQVQPSLERAGVLASMRAAYRHMDAGGYVVLWPKGFTGGFSVA